MKTYTIAETFIGAGGSHIGFSKAGFKGVYLNDNTQIFIDTLAANNKIDNGAFVDVRSILDVKGKEILDKTGLKPKELDVLFGGIVCKGFSLAGERSPNDERNYFYHKQLELMSVLKPKVSIIENVPGIAKARVLSPNTPLEIRNLVDQVWQDLEDYKGQKAELRKRNKLTEEFLTKGENLRSKKKELQQELEEKGYLISVIEDIFNIYEKYGYKVKKQIVNTAWYGAATKRERMIIVGVRKDIKGEFKYPKVQYYDKGLKTKIPEDMKNEKYKKPVTVGDALKTIDYSNKNDLDNESMNHAPKTVKRFKYIPEGKNIISVIDDLPTDLHISKFYSRGNTMRLDRNKPSPTLVPGHSNFPVHPWEHRSITVREAATITGFPNDYKFVGSHTKRCEQVGNAVPPLLAYNLGLSVKELLESNT